MTWVSNKFKQFITNKKFKRQKLRPSWACDDSFSWSTRKLWNSKEIFLSQNICWKNWQVYLMVTKMWYGKYHITLYFLKHHLFENIIFYLRLCQIHVWPLNGRLYFGCFRKRCYSNWILMRGYRNFHSQANRTFRRQWWCQSLHLKLFLVWKPCNIERFGCSSHSQ